MVLFQPIEVPRQVAGPEAAGLMFASLVLERTEVAAFAYLGTDLRVLGIRHARSNSATMLDLPVRDIAADAIAFDAAAVVMAHNHPSGDPTPSIADKDATRLLARALAPLEVRLLDHLVVARGGVTSFRTLGLL